MAWTEQRRNLWVGYYRDAAGKKLRAGSSPSKREAKQWALDEEAKQRAGTWHDPRAGALTFSTYFEEHWLPHRGGEINTLVTHESHYNSTLKAAFGSIELRKIEPGLVQRWVTRMEKDGVTPSNIRAKFITLQTVLAARKGVSALRDKKIAANPCAGITLPTVDARKVNIYSIEESDRLVAALPAWYRPLPLVEGETGCRWGEMLGFRVNDFADDFAWVWVENTILELTRARTGNGTRFMWKPRPKGKTPRKVALQNSTSHMVAQLVRDRRLFGNDRLFSAPDPEQPGQPLRTSAWPEGLPVSRNLFGDLWHRAHVEAGIERNGRRPHDLRGSHISWLLAGGADLATVMERVGHRDSTTTMRYLAALGDADRRAIDALERTQARYRRADG